MDSLWTSRPTYRVLLDSPMADLHACLCLEHLAALASMRLIRVERRRSASLRGSHTVLGYTSPLFPGRSGGTGRRARLRGVWGNPWGFESPLRHHLHPPGLLHSTTRAPPRLAACEICGIIGWSGIR